MMKLQFNNKFRKIIPIIFDCQNKYNYHFDQQFYIFAYLLIIAFNQEMKTQKLKYRGKKKKNFSTQQQPSPINNLHSNYGLGFLLKQETDTEAAKHELRKVSEDVCHEREEDCNGNFWDHVQINQVIRPNDQQSKNKVRRNQQTSYQIYKNGEASRVYAHSQNKLRAKEQLKMIKDQKSIERSIFQNKNLFFNNRHKNFIQNENYNYNYETQAQQKNQKKMLGKNKSTGQFTEKCSDKLFKTQIGQSVIVLGQQPNKNYHSPSLHQQYSRTVLVTPQIKLHARNENSKNDKECQNLNKKQFLSTVYLKIPQFRNKKPKMRKAMTVHHEQNFINCHANKNSFYTHKTNTICVLQKPIEDSNKHISLSNFQSSIHTYSKLTRVLNNSELLRKNKQKCKYFSSLLNARQHDKNLGLITRKTLSNQTQEAQIEKGSSTTLFRQEFERLRKLLRKQTKNDFKIDDDSPMKIVKI